MKNEFLKKTPLELTEEELVELVNQIMFTEYSKRQDIRQLQSYEDGAQDFLCYMYEKSAKGKVGINEIKQKSMAHFKNIVYLEARNGINYITRKNKTRQYLYNTISLDEKFDEDSKSVEETYVDKTEIYKFDNDISMSSILNSIDDTEDENIIIKYGVGNKNFILNFSFRNLTKLYLMLFNGKKVSTKEFNNLLYNKKTNTCLSEKEITGIIRKFKNYIKSNNILGGIVCS